MPSINNTSARKLKTHLLRQQQTLSITAVAYQWLWQAMAMAGSLWKSFDCIDSYITFHRHNRVTGQYRGL